MSKAEWGSKRLCSNCAAAFYDLHLSPIRCPKCDAEFRPAATLVRSRAPKRVAPKWRGRAKAEPMPSEDHEGSTPGSPPLRATDVEETDVDQGIEDDDDVLDTDDEDDEAEDKDEDAAGESEDDEVPSASGAGSPR